MIYPSVLFFIFILVFLSMFIILYKTSSNKTHPYVLGENYFIRTVTHHYTGKLIKVYDQELVLITAAWIADDGRFATALNTGRFNEIEPFPKDKKVLIGRGSIIDASIFNFPLPTQQK